MLLPAIRVGAQDETIAPNTSKTNRWERFYTIKAGAGYNDNILRTKDHPTKSPFVSGAAEVFAIRIPDGRNSAYGFLSLDHTQYLDGESVEKEQTVLALFHHDHLLRENLHLGGGLSVSLSGSGFRQFRK